MEISVANRQRKVDISSRHARLIATSVLQGESASFDEISLAFVGDRTMRRLNRTFAGRDGSTDTLAFELTAGRVGEKPIVGKSLGEVIVCVDRAMEQSTRYRVSLQKEIARLLIHSLLHLCGFNDGTKSTKARMRRRENVYIASLAGPISFLIRPPRGAAKSRSSTRRGVSKRQG